MNIAETSQQSDNTLIEKLMNKWRKKIQRGFLRLIVLRMFHEKNEYDQYVGYHGLSAEHDFLENLGHRIRK